MTLVAAPALMARTFVAFGPQTFGRFTGAPQDVTLTFDVRNPNTSYTLEITDNTVSSAVVTLNGARIFAPNDFNQQVTHLSAAVTLQTHNTLQVELRGGPGDGFSLHVLSVDNDPPTIRATATPAANAAGWNRTDVTVTFTCDDAISGVATCPSSTLVSNEGVAAVSGTAIDTAGNSASAALTVRLDKTAPQLAVTAPAANATVSAAGVSLTGTVTDALSGIASLSCNGLPATVSQGTFTCAVTLVPGLNSISLQAVDVAGNASSTSHSLRLSATPSVQIIEPQNFSFGNISPITVRGTVSDPTVTIKVNGVSAPVSNGTFSVVVPLVEGNNTLTAVATTPGGMVGTGSVQVTLDTTPPRVTIQSPADGFATTDATVGVSGIVNDVVVGTVNDQEAQVTVNGVAAAVANRSFIASSVPLTVGDNVIQAIGRDRVGNSFTASIHVRRDAAAGARIATVSGSGQTAPIATRLQAAIVARVTNASGAPVAGQSVVFRVVQNDGMLSDGNSAPKPSLVATTAADGTARAQWTLGSRSGAGANRVEATATGFSGTALFTATGTPGQADALFLDAGADQSGATGEALYYPFVVVVTDGGHNRRAGVPVTFRVTGGGGKLGGQTAVTVNTDGDGRALARLTLGPEAGYNNNTVEASIAGGERPVAFAASAKMPGNVADTKITGIVVDNSNAPIAGATMRLYQAYQANNSNIPIPIGTPVVTDAQGQFVMTGVPVGSFKLVADGTTVTTASYPSVEYDITTVAGQTNTVNSPIYLPVLDTVNRICVSPTTGGTLTLPASPGFSLTIAPGSATFPGGSRTGCITVTPVHGDKVPMVPGFGQQPRFVVTIQPVGTHFNPPAQISIPNVDGLRPREVTEMYSYDHDLSSFIAIGTGTVSADGSRIVSDPGVGVMKAGWHCGGNPNAAGGAASTSVSVDKPSITIPVGGDDDVTATGSPTPPGNPGYTWTSADTAKATVAYAPGNNSQTHPNKGRIHGVAAGNTTVKVEYRCQSGQTADATVTVKVVDADKIQATVPSTKNAATGAKPNDQTFDSTGRDTNFNTTNMMTVLMKAGDIKLKAINPQPDANDLHWQIDRNPDDSVAGGTPPMGTAGAEVTLTPNTPGHFRVILYVDINSNNQWDSGEEVRTIKIAIVRPTFQPGHSISTDGQFNPLQVGNVTRVHTTMSAMIIQLDVLLEGGGADRQIGVDHIILGDVGVLRADDTFVINYPVPSPAPPPPGDVAGFEREHQNGDIPMIDTGRVPAKNTEPTGGDNAFRTLSTDQNLGAGPGGNGTLHRVGGIDAPQFAWPRLHPTTHNPWSVTNGGNAFKEGIVAYSDQFIRNYVAVGAAIWTVVVTGNTDANGAWVANNASISVQGVKGTPGGASAALTTFSAVQPDTVGVQVRGFSFVRNVTLDPTP